MKRSLLLKIILSSALILSRQPAFSQEKPELQCFGTEPFWVASLYQDKVTFTLLGEETLEIKGDLITPLGVAAEYAQNFVSESLVISSLSGQCNDGMSDRLYSRHAMAQFIGEKKMGLLGCCQPINLPTESNSN